MELNELKLKWNELDTRLSKVETVNNQALKELMQLRANTAFTNLRNKLWFELLVSFFVSAIMIFFLSHNAEINQVLNPYTIIMTITWLVLSTAYAIYRTARFGSFDITKPTVQLMKLSNNYKRDYSIRRLMSYPLFGLFTILFVFFERGWIIERGRVVYAVIWCIAILALFFFSFREELRRQQQLIDEVDRTIKELSEVE